MLSSINSLIENLKGVAETEHKPILFKLETNADLTRFNALLKEYPFIQVIDNISNQIKELIKITHPDKQLTEDEYIQKTNEFVDGKEPALVGTWCYYPWSRNLVHILNKDDYISVRTNRNLLKIKKEEQQLLLDKTIGIIGLSVGQAIAVTIAMERVCGKIKLADFDTVDLSNLNRLRTGVHNLGKSKVIIAAREIAEIDPYIEIEIHKEGISSKNIDDFISDLSVLVEVCDDITTKITSRLAAKKYKVPVVMDTNDRGMVDVERFDLEPDRPIFHGLVNETDLSHLSAISHERKMGLIMKIVSFELTSDRLKESMSQIGKTISTWPQLASSIMLGAGATVDCCRRILLNQTTQSGRYYIDLEQLVP
ncbi:MAG: ThiF family adenylyltransferase [Bacteroidia bacterium]|nr:ThiF family adenylyltransferase [Bacteroidia bacterium]MCC7533307.1 ThiF family adenylyltransferase [Bacteroidia bacterium]